MERKNEDVALWDGCSQIDWKLAGARFFNDLNEIIGQLSPELRSKIHVSILCPDVTPEEVEKTFAQYREDGAEVLSQNSWDSTVKVLPSIFSLIDYVGVRNET